MSTPPHTMVADMLAHNPYLHQQSKPLLVAISGGPDSMVLAHLCQQAGLPMALAHVNYQLRGAESDADEALVTQLARQWNLSLHVHKATMEVQPGHSIQEAARSLRYAWFGQLCQQHGYGLILTAHHAQDNTETMVFNLFRGTGLRGLAGMQPLQGGIARPLLWATRAQIEAYAAAHNLPWRTDGSNLKSQYARNHIRLQVIPGLEPFLPHTAQRLMVTQQRLQEAELLYKQGLQHALKKLQPNAGQPWRVPIRALLKAVPLHTISWELLKPFGFSWAQVGEALRKTSQTQQATCVLETTATHQLVKNRLWWEVLPLQPAPPAGLPVLLQTKEGEVQLPGATLYWKIVPPGHALPQGPNQLLANASLLHWPLLVRPWQAGDYCYPLGMRKKKKVARLLIDAKYSPAQKQTVWVVESQQRIIWVPGLRADERFKVTGQEQELLWMEWRPAIGNVQVV